MKETIYYISGMHCASCELLVEKRLLKEKDVKSVDASLGNGLVRIEHYGKVPSVHKLNQWFLGDGYTFSTEKSEKKKEPLLYVLEGTRGVHIDKRLLKKKLSTLLKIFAVWYVLYLIEKTGIAGYITVTEASSLGVFFVFGLVAGLSSCAALVGGILLSLTKSWNEQYGYDATTKDKMIPHIYFHSGRFISYAILGGFLGAVGKVIAFDNVTVYVCITLAVSIVMLFIGLQMAGVSWAERFQIKMPKRVTRVVAGAKGKNIKMPFVIGGATVLLPCGFTLIAQGIALTSGSFVMGSLIMIAFVFGTMIPLLFIGFASIQGTKNAKRGRAFSFYSGVVLVIFAFYNINGQFNVLGFPSMSNIFTQDGGVSVFIEESQDSGSEQVVTLVAKGFRYTLTSSNTIQAGVPTTLIVDDQGIQGCGVFLAARGLIDGFVDLKLGKNVIDLGIPQKGTYNITCSMGMVPPVTLRVQ